MSCFAYICGAQDEQTKAKEAELKARVKQLQADLSASNAKVAEAKEKREKTEHETLEKEQRAMELQAKVKTKRAIAQQVAAAKQATTGGCFGCFEGAQDKEKNMKAQVEKLQLQLLASQDEVSAVRSRAQTAQQEVTLQKTNSIKERKDMAKQAAAIKPAPAKALESRPSLHVNNQPVQRTMSINSMFMRDVNNFRTQTPANQRQMKGSIVELLNKIREAESELQEEEALTQMSQAEAAKHEKTVKQLEPQLTETDEPFAFMKSCGSKAWFRTKTPAQQRQIKDELWKCLQDLEGVQQEKIENQLIADNSGRKLSDLRKRGGQAEQEVAREQSKSNTFAFKGS